MQTYENLRVFFFLVLLMLTLRFNNWTGDYFFNISHLFYLIDEKKVGPWFWGPLFFFGKETMQSLRIYKVILSIICFSPYSHVSLKELMILNSFHSLYSHSYNVTSTVDCLAHFAITENWETYILNKEKKDYHCGYTFCY